MFRMAFVLHHWPHPLIERATLRALLPKGKQVAMPPDRVARYRARGDYRVGRYNRVSHDFTKRLGHWERRFGAIRREGTRVVILDRQFFAPMADLLVIDKAMWLAEIVQEYRHADVAPETRRRELLTLQRLMQAGPGSNGSGRGAVRLLPRSKTL